MVRNLKAVDVSDRHANPFGLATIVPAQEVRVTKHAASAVAVQELLSLALVHDVTARIDFILAVVAFPAGNAERDDDPISDFEVLHVRACVNKIRISHNTVFLHLQITYQLLR